MHPAIDNKLKPGVKLTEIKPVLTIVAAQQKLNLTRNSEFKKALRIINISINHN